MSARSCAGTLASDSRRRVIHQLASSPPSLQLPHLPTHLSRPEASMRDTDASTKPPCPLASAAPPPQPPCCCVVPSTELSQEAADAALGARECPRDSRLPAPLPRSEGEASR